MSDRTKEKVDVAAFRLPEWLRDLAESRCTQEDIRFSQLMRRAIRKELGLETAVPPATEKKAGK